MTIIKKNTEQNGRVSPPSNSAPQEHILSGLTQRPRRVSGANGNAGPGRRQLLNRVPQRPPGSPVLCLDRDPSNATSLYRYRSTADLTALQGRGLDLTGMENLHLSCSASLASPGDVETLYRLSNGSFLVLAIREESYASVGDLPATWMLPNDWANVGKSSEEVALDQNARIDQLKRQDTVTLIHKADFKAGLVAPRTVTLEQPVILDERTLVENGHGLFDQITVTDHCRPRPQQVDRYLEIVRSIPKGMTLHIHCQGGRGRSTTGCVEWDMLHNAGNVSAHEIIRRQEVFGLDYDISGEPGAKPHKDDFRQDRLEFLLEFYEYAKAYPIGHPHPPTWTEWRGEESNLIRA